MPVRAARLRRLRDLLGHYDVEHVATVGARVRSACVASRPEDAEEYALVITLDLLRHRAAPYDVLVLSAESSVRTTVPIR